MNPKIKYTFFLFCFSFILQAQTLSGDYQGYLYRNYYIGKYQKGRYVLIDSVQVDGNGKFSKFLDPRIYTPNALYVVASEGEYKEKKNIENPHPHGSIRFVYTGQDVSYRTSWRQETGYLSFLKGGEASVDLKELDLRLKTTQSVLSAMEQLLALLEPTDAFYTKTMADYGQKAQDFNAFCKEIAARYPKDSYMNLYALMFQQVVPLKGMNFEDFESYRAKNLFQFTDLKNPLVADVPMLQPMFRSYLYYNQPSGMVMSDVIQKQQDQAKFSFQKAAASEVLEALSMQGSRPQVQVWREQFTKELDFDSLYQDNEAWFASIDGILGAYDASSPYHLFFGKDVITALERTQSPEAYTKLAEAAFSITEQFNWGEAQTEIVSYLTEKADARLLRGTGKVAQIYALKGLRPGTQAPDLVLTGPGKRITDGKGSTTVLKTTDLGAAYNFGPLRPSLQDVLKTTGLDAAYSLLVFYQSGCGPCEATLEGLKNNYTMFTEKGLRIISFAADQDEQMYKNTAAQFPWKDTFCDFKGLSGINFKNYAVMGTPTLYLLDKDGIIISRLATVEELLSWLQSK